MDALSYVATGHRLYGVSERAFVITLSESLDKFATRLLCLLWNWRCDRAAIFSFDRLAPPVEALAEPYNTLGHQLASVEDFVCALYKNPRFLAECLVAVRRGVAVCANRPLLVL
jgi:hypothetical protein